jgi:hypothetical protein
MVLSAILFVLVGRINCVPLGLARMEYGVNEEFEE